MKQWWRRIWLIGLGAVILGALVYGFMPQPLAVDVAQVRRGPLRVTVEEEGKTRLKDRFVLSAPVPGFRRRIELNVGDAVQAGQVLVRLEPLRSTVLDARSRAQAEAALSAAQASLHVAEESVRAAVADADLAQAELRRVTRLFESGDIAQDAVEQADAVARRTQAAHRSAVFAVEVARFEVQAAETALQYSAAEEGGAAGETVAIRAPVDSSVLRIPDESERVVAAGEPLLEIGDPGALEVEVDVLSADAVRLGPGTRVLFERWGGTPALEGQVRVVEPVGFTKISALGVEEQRVLVIADIVSPRDEWARLGDGYRVEASFILWEGEDVLQIPASALFRSDAGWAVFVIDGERAVHRTVEVGHRNGITAEIVSGLAEGDTIVPHPDDAIEDGVRVRPRAT